MSKPQHSAPPYVRAYKTKIELEFMKYKLDSMLINIHNSYMNSGKANFVAAMMTRFALLNSKMYFCKEITGIELDYLSKMIIKYSVLDPKFIINDSPPTNEEILSFVLGKIGSQFRYDIRLQNKIGQTKFMYEVLAKDENADEFIKKIINEDFEQAFGVPFKEFIYTGFYLFARSNANKNGLTRADFDFAREKGIILADDETIKKIMKFFSITPLDYYYFCNKYNSNISGLEAYELNPILLFPLIRPWGYLEELPAEKDKFIATIPALLIYRISTGMYYQLANHYDDAVNKKKKPFRDAFGRFFEMYVGWLIENFELDDATIYNVDELCQKYQQYRDDRPDWVIVLQNKIILIECKSSMLSQDFFLYGINATDKACLEEMRNGLIQLSEFEQAIKNDRFNELSSHKSKPIMKVIIALDSLLDVDIELMDTDWTYMDSTGLELDPIKLFLKISPITEFSDLGRWLVISVDNLESLQPHIKEKKDIWAIFNELIDEPFYKVINRLIKETGKGTRDSCLHPYFEEVMDEMGVGASKRGVHKEMLDD